MKALVRFSDSLGELVSDGAWTCTLAVGLLCDGPSQAALFFSDPHKEKERLPSPLPCLPPPIP